MSAVQFCRCSFAIIVSICTPRFFCLSSHLSWADIYAYDSYHFPCVRQNHSLSRRTARRIDATSYTRAKNPYKNNVITVLTMAQATQHGFNFPSRSYRKLRIVLIDILINVQEYVPILERWRMFFRYLDSYYQLLYRIKFNHLVWQYCKHCAGLVRYQWVFHFVQRMTGPNNTPWSATHLDIGSESAIPAASFVIIRRLSLMIRRSNNIASKRDVSELVSPTWNIHRKVCPENRVAVRPLPLHRASCNPDDLKWVD